jgi:hypothetical protein
MFGLGYVNIIRRGNLEYNVDIGQCKIFTEMLAILLIFVHSCVKI